jgi:hypothetical protein
MHVSGAQLQSALTVPNRTARLRASLSILNCAILDKSQQTFKVCSTM